MDLKFAEPFDRILSYRLAHLFSALRDRARADAVHMYGVCADPWGPRAVDRAGAVGIGH